MTAEYPPYLTNITMKDKNINADMLSLIYNISKEFRERIEETFEATFAKNVYEACKQGLRLHEADLVDVFTYCSDEEYKDINITDFFLHFPKEFGPLLMMNPVLVSRKSSNSSAVTSTTTSSSGQNFLGTQELKTERLRSTEITKRPSEQHIEFRDTSKEKFKIDMYDLYFDNLLEFLVKKIDGTQSFIEQTKSDDELLNRCPKNLKDYVRINSNVKFL